MATSVLEVNVGPPLTNILAVEHLILSYFVIIINIYTFFRSFERLVAKLTKA